MIIKIDEIKDELVFFSCEVGSGIGLWGVKDKPLIKEYYVEFTVTIPVIPEQNATIVSDSQMFIRQSGDMNEIQGLVEQLDDDGLIYLRLAKGCLIMLENENDVIKVGDYLLVRVAPIDMEIYPV